RDRDRDPAGPDPELDDRPARLPRLLQVEGDVLGDADAPGVVELGNRVVRARLWIHRHILGTRGHRSQSHVRGQSLDVATSDMAPAIVVCIGAAQWLDSPPWIGTPMPRRPRPHTP